MANRVCGWNATPASLRATRRSIRSSISRTALCTASRRDAGLSVVRQMGAARFGDGVTRVFVFGSMVVIAGLFLNFSSLEVLRAFGGESFKQNDFFPERNGWDSRSP